MKRITALFLTTLLIFAILPVSAFAGNSVYEQAYNVHDAIWYAEQWAGNDGKSGSGVYNSDKYERIPANRSYDCTNFVSQCLVAGGIPETSQWNSDRKYGLISGYSDAYNTFVNVDLLCKYLSGCGYSVEEGNSVSVSAGDVVQFDWENDGRYDHSTFCVGSVNGKPCYAAHDSNRFMEPYENITNNPSYSTVIVGGELLQPGISVRVIHLTDTAGLKDISEKYAGKTIAIKSIESNQYVSANTDQRDSYVNATANRSTASTWEYFDVVQGDYGEIGFRSRSTGNFLSARIDDNDKYAYIQSAAYSHNYSKPQSWESFRIFEKDGIQYIQSQANGKWTQAAVNETDNPLKAAGAHASTWEQFKIEIVNPSSGGNTGGSNGGNTGGTGGNTGGGTSGDSGTTKVSQHYHGTDFNEGWYEGEWSNGHPNGYGKLTYDDFGDGKYYKLNFDDGSVLKAIYYEGQFSNGWRYGSGTVVYENDWRDEGTFYGQWQAGKVVFVGKRWHGNSYCPLTITATSAVEGNDSYGEWVSVSGSNTKTYTITYDANGGTGAPSSQAKTHGKALTLRNEKPTRSGYSFLGWSTNKTASSASYSAGASFTADSNTTLYAVWKQVNRSAKVIKAYLGQETTTAYKDEEVVFVEYEITGYATGDIWLTFEDLATGKQIYRFGPVVSQVRTSLLTKYHFTQGHTYRIYFTEDDRTKVGDSYVDFTYKMSPAFSLSVPSPWAQDSIVKAYDMNLIPQYMMRDYSLVTTRIDFVRLAFNVIEQHSGWMQQILYDNGLVDSTELGPSLAFDDVPFNCGYDEYDGYRVAALNTLGIVLGVGNDKFEPYREITREEAAVLLSRVHSFLRWGEVRYYSYKNSTINLYDDNDSISSWAVYDVYNMKAIDVMNGIGNNRFSPKGTYAIEQSIVTFVRLLDK